MHTGVNIHAFEGKEIPDDYLKIVLGKNPTYFGVAAMLNGRLAVTRKSGVQPEAAVKALGSLQKQLKSPALMHFASVPTTEELHKEDMQPYVLLSSGDSVPLLSCVIDGTFLASKQPTSTWSDKFHVVNDIIQPKLADIFDATGNDLKKLMDYIRKPSFFKELSQLTNQPFDIQFLSANGELIECRTKVAGNPDYGKFDWGIVSNTYGYGEAPSKVVEPEPPKEPGLDDFFGDEATPELAPGVHAVPEKTPQPEIVGKLGPAPVREDWIEVTELVPKGMNNKNRKKWFNARVAQLPPDWDRLQTLTFRRPRQIHEAEVQKIEDLTSTTAPIKDFKDLATHNIPTKPDNWAGQVTGGIQPVIPPKQLEDIKTRFIGTWVDQSSKEIPGPDELKSLEEKQASFFDQTGFTAEDTYKLQYPAFEELATNDPCGAAVLLWNYRNMLLMALSKMPTKKQEAPQPAPTQTATPGAHARQVHSQSQRVLRNK